MHTVVWIVKWSAADRQVALKRSRNAAKEDGIAVLITLGLVGGVVLPWARVSAPACLQFVGYGAYSSGPARSSSWAALAPTE